MKKTLMYSLVLALLFVPFLGRAQTTPATTDDVSALRSELIALLTQEIASLQAQIQQILTNQATQQTQLNTVVQPSFGGTELTGIPTPSYMVTANLADLVFPQIDVNGSPLPGYVPPVNSRISVQSNGTLDIPSTEVYVNGAKQNVTITTLTPSLFTITPSFESLIPTDPQGAVNQSGNFVPGKAGAVQLVYHFTDGTTLSTKVNSVGCGLGRTDCPTKLNLNSQ